MNVGFSRSGFTPTALNGVSGSLMACAAAFAKSVRPRAPRPAPTVFAPKDAIAGTPSTTAAPSAPTRKRLDKLAAESSAPVKSSVSILLVGPASKKSPRVSTSGVVAAMSAPIVAPSLPNAPNPFAPLTTTTPGPAN